MDTHQADDLTAPDDTLAMSESVALPHDFTPQSSAPIPLDQPQPRLEQADDVWEPLPTRDLWQRFIGPSLMLTALLVALASCAFMGWRS